MNKSILIVDDSETVFITMLTSSSDERDRNRAKDFPFVEMFLEKPFQKSYVALLIDKLNQKV